MGLKLYPKAGYDNLSAKGKIYERMRVTPLGKLLKIVSMGACCGGPVKQWADLEYAVEKMEEQERERERERQYTKNSMQRSRSRKREEEEGGDGGEADSDGLIRRTTMEKVLLKEEEDQKQKKRLQALEKRRELALQIALASQDVEKALFAEKALGEEVKRGRQRKKGGSKCMYQNLLRKLIYPEQAAVSLWAKARYKTCWRHPALVDPVVDIGWWTVTRVGIGTRKHSATCEH